MAGFARHQERSVLAADKGRATVLLDRADYVNKANTLLQDSNTYAQLKKDPTDKIKSKGKLLRLFLKSGIVVI